MSEPVFLTVGEMATRYRVRPWTIRSWMATGQIPQPLRIGHGLRWLLSDIEEFERQKVAEARERAEAVRERERV